MFFSLLFNSNAVSIEETFKQRVISGIPKIVYGYNFSLQVNIHRIVIIDSVGLGSNCTNVENYEIFELPRGNKIESQSVLSKGSYFINFFIPEENDIAVKSNCVCLYYLKSGKVKEIIATTKNKQDLVIKEDDSLNNMVIVND